MTINLEHYITIAELFEYPGNNFSKNVHTVQALLDSKYPEAAAELKPFTDFTINSISDEQQEIYTRTFDVQALTTLDLGYVLFGDDYKRGELLSNLNREHAAAGNELHNQLADHLPNLLRLLPKLKDRELLEELISQIISPAMIKILSEFDPDRIISKNELYKKHHNTLIETSDKYAAYYQHALRSFYLVLKTDFNIENISPPEQASDFLSSIQNEIELEHSK